MQYKTILYDRKSGRLQEENLGNSKFLIFLNKNKLGRYLLELVFKQRFFTKWSGLYYSSGFSKLKIKQFIAKYDVKVSEIEGSVEEFKSFNDFFTRKLKAGARALNQNPKILIAPADSRMIYYKLNKGSVIIAKGIQYTLKELIQNEGLAKEYEEGMCLVFRLAPTDYHRFCMIDTCQQSPVVSIPGYYNTVRTAIAPHTVQVTNHRHYCILETINFGKVIQVEVGAMQIGKIQQMAIKGGYFQKGDEKGYFEYGGSTIIQIFKKGIINLDQDIIRASHQGIETIVRQGERIGCSKMVHRAQSLSV